MFRPLLVAIIRLIQRIQKERNNTAAILVGDLGPYSVLHAVTA
jgi:hypothetical protein